MSCDPQAVHPCPSGYICPVTYFSTCVPGCASDSDCDGGAVCDGCTATCVTPGNPASALGSRCAIAADCPTGTHCELADAGFPGGYCTASCVEGCGCGDAGVCFGALELCVATCRVSAVDSCREGYSCAPRDATDLGQCLPACTTDDACELLAAGSRCDPDRRVCVPPGITWPPDTAASSATSSSGSASSAPAAPGTSASGSTGGSTGPGTSAGCGCQATDALGSFSALGLGLGRRRSTRAGPRRLRGRPAG